MEANFNNPSLFIPDDVRARYRSVNKESDIKAQASDDGVEIHVAAAKADGSIAGILLLRVNPYAFPDHRLHGDLEIRRIHVDPKAQGKGLGTEFLKLTNMRAEQHRVEYITAHSSGNSRNFFEENEYEGFTLLHSLGKEGPAALVFACRKFMGPEEVNIYPNPKNIYVVGENDDREEMIRKIAGDTSVHRINSVAHRPEKYALDAARAKAVTASSQLASTSGVWGNHENGDVPVVIATEQRVNLIGMTNNANRYGWFATKEVSTPDEIMAWIRIARGYVRETGKDAPVREEDITYVHNPMLQNVDTYQRQDLSYFLNREAVETLSDSGKFSQYRAEAYDGYGIDVTKIPGGLALPVLMDRGYVVGINAQPLDALSRPKRDKLIKRALHQSQTGLDIPAVKQRLDQRLKTS